MKRISSLLTAVAIAATSLVAASSPANANPQACALATQFDYGTGASNDPWEINSIGELHYLIQLGSAASSGKHFKIMQDLNMAGCQLTPSAQSFQGTVNGGSSKLSNFVVTAADAGLFRRASGAYIYNLNIDSAQVTGTDFAGAVVGSGINGTRLSNIKVENSTIVTTGSGRVGGIAGTLWTGNRGTLDRLRVNNSIVRGNFRVGGIAGAISGWERVENAVVLGSTISNYSAGGIPILGGLFGIVEYAGDAPASGQSRYYTIDRSAFRGTIDLSAGAPILTYAAGLVGRFRDATASVENSYAKFDLLAQGDTFAYGLFDTQSQASTVTNTYVSARFLSGSVQIAATPLGANLTSATASFYDTTAHSNWTTTAFGVGKTSTELQTQSTFSSYSMTANASAVAAATATEPWFFSPAFGGGGAYLTYEYQFSSMVPCVVGRYSHNGVDDCRPAPMGHYVAFTGSFAPVPCDAGTFSGSSGANSCQPAPAGSYVPIPRQFQAIQCPVGTYQPNPGQASCIVATAGSFVANPGATSQQACPAGTTSQPQASLCTPVVSYSGPSVSTPGSTVRAGSTLNLLGSGLDTVTSASIDGIPVEIVAKTSTSITLRIPTVSNGPKDLVLTSASGNLTVQGALTVVGGDELTTQQFRVSIKRVANRARIVATDLVGLGKVEIRVNGRVIAWVNAIDGSDPKLRQSPNLSSPYLVRTPQMSKGKNVIEVVVAGERVKRVVYTR